MAQRGQSNRRGNTRGASRQAEAEQAGGALRWYTAGLLTGLMVAFLLYVVTLPPETPEGDDGPVTTQIKTQTQPPELEYEFYELLPNQEITVDVDPADIPRPRSDSSAKQYLLQAGSFRQQADADRRRAELLLLGLEPRIESTQGDTGRWLRVVIGPFENRSAMARARSLTAQQDIDTLLIQRKRD
ncbi:MAG: SPOR domain-containing protein [Congregibacter sp.]